MHKRTSNEIMQLVMDFANKHPQVKLIGMEGSRNNPNQQSDSFSDFDVTYFVDDFQNLTQLRDTINWECEFGTTIIVQELFENFVRQDEKNAPGYTRMMLFTDGNRIDLKILLTSDVPVYLDDDHLNSIIFGGQTNQPNESSHFLKAPTSKELAQCTNEFYWVSTYVVKGLCRNQILYANNLFERIVREELFKLMDWYYFTGENPGKEHQRLLTKEPDLVERLYGNTTIDGTWQCLFEAMTEFYGKLDAMGIVRPDYIERVWKYAHEKHDEFQI